MKHLALHTCCAPCLIGVHSVLAAEADHITVVFYNPNIAPSFEYSKRRNACEEYARDKGIRFFEITPSDDWTEAQSQIDVSSLSAIQLSLEEQREMRCRTCYDLRLGRVAVWAIEHGCDGLATTLSISPFQNIATINQIGEAKIAAFCDINFIAADFREHHRDAQRMARHLGIYCQNYCGCLPSKAEAAKQRADRKR